MKRSRTSGRTSPTNAGRGGDGKTAKYLAEDRDQAGILRISGTLCIQDAGEFRTALVHAFDKAKAVEVDASSVTEADVSCLQLLCSAHRTSKQMNKFSGLSENASASFKKSVRQAGYARPSGCLLDTDKQCVWKEERLLIGRVFRTMHTIKGSGAMFGFDRIAKFTHEIETVYDKIRNGQIPVTKEIISLTLRVRDAIKEMLDDPSGEAPEPSFFPEIVSSFKKLADAEGERDETPP